MSKWRKKPVVIDAVQINPEAGSALFEESIPRWLALAMGVGQVKRAGAAVRINTLEGEMTANPGDWIIRGVLGEIYPCKPDIFAQTYEPA